MSKEIPENEPRKIEPIDPKRCQTMKIMETLFAFWKHDHMPYCLGGRITKIVKKGLVETKEYGKGHLFRPFLILPLAEGKEIMEKLEELQAQKRDEEIELIDKYRNKVASIISIPKS